MSAATQLANLAEEVAKVQYGTEEGDNQDGTVNGGDPVKIREFQNKVQDIVKSVDDSTLAKVRHNINQGQQGDLTRGQRIIINEINNEIIRRRTTPR